MTPPEVSQVGWEAINRASGAWEGVCYLGNSGGVSQQPSSVDYLRPLFALPVIRGIPQGATLPPLLQRLGRTWSRWAGPRVGTHVSYTWPLGTHRLTVAVPIDWEGGGRCQQAGGDHKLGNLNGRNLNLNLFLILNPC